MRLNWKSFAAVHRWRCRCGAAAAQQPAARRFASLPLLRQQLHIIQREGFLSILICLIKVCFKLARSYPFLDSPLLSKTPSNVGMMLSTYTGPPARAGALVYISAHMTDRAAIYMTVYARQMYQES